MKINSLIALLAYGIFAAINIFAQVDKNDFPKPNLNNAEPPGINQAARQSSEISRERRSQAYVKLLEAQRYIWITDRLRQSSEARANSTQLAIAANSKLAKQAFQKAAELEPTLAEAYTGLANLTKFQNIEESILLAGIAVKIDANNFGAHQNLAQLYTYKSLLNPNSFNLIFAQKAIAEWNEIARLDSRNAEAFAFLSELYEKTNQKKERIAALRSWLASSLPTSNGFYGLIFQGESLAPQTALVKLGQALLEEKQTKEAVEILSRAVAEDAENLEAIKLLSAAIESADNSLVNPAIQSLQQAIFANPDNPALFLLLAQVQSRTGKVEDAVKVLRDASGKFAKKNKIVSADLQVALADIYGDSNRVDEAAAGYQNALTIRGIDKYKEMASDDRDFAVLVFEKIINLYQKAKRPIDAKAAIERARLVLGEKDLFADKQISSS